MVRKALGIDQSQMGVVMHYLSRYTQPAAAVMREYVSNAVDAVKGMPNGSVTVIMPKMDEDSTFVVKDNGIGMSNEFMVNDFSNYATSTKRDSKGNPIVGDTIGSKGIGSKAAFSVSDSFTISSVHDGEKTTIHGVIDANGGGYFDYEDARKTNEANGTVVTVPVAADIANSMHSHLNDTLRGFDSSIVTVLNNDGTPSDVVKWIDSLDNRLDLSDTMMLVPNIQGFHILQGGVWYSSNSELDDIVGTTRQRNSVTSNAIDKVFYSSSWRRFLYGLNGIVIKVKGNELTMNPSREAFEATAQNAKVILDIIKKNADAITAKGGIDYINSLLDTDEFRNLSWEQAAALFHVISPVFRTLSRNEDKKFSIGGHSFSDAKAVISLPKDSLIATKKSPRALNSSYDTKKCQMNDDGSYSTTLWYRRFREDARTLIVSDVPENDFANNVATFLRRRRVWAEEDSRVRDISTIGTIIFPSNGYSINDNLGYWEAKKANDDLVYTTYDDFVKLIDARNERMKEQRRIERKNNPTARRTTVQRVSYAIADGFHSSFASDDLDKLEQVCASNNIPLYYAEKDEYDAMKADRQRLSSLSRRSGIVHMDKYATKTTYIIRLAGSKRLMNDIKESVPSYHDIDRLLPLHVQNAYDTVMNGAALYETKRILSGIIGQYALTVGRGDDAHRSIFSVLLGTDRLTGETKEKISLLSGIFEDIASTKENRVAVPDYNTALKLLDLGATKSGAATMQAVEDCRDLAEWFDARYPMLRMMRKNMIFITSSISDIANEFASYILLVDKSGEN